MSEIPRTLVVTGGTSGLGLSVVQLFASRGYHVWILSRCQQEIDTVIKSIQQKHPTAILHGREMDLGEMSSVRQALAKLKGQLSVIDVLLCNTSMWLDDSYRQSTDGIESTFASNHLGHFLLVHQLLPFVPSHGHIGLVSGGAHLPEHDLSRRLGFPIPVYTSAERLAHPPKTEQVGGVKMQSLRYTTSKLCNMIFANRLAEWLQEQHLSSKYNPIFVWSMYPGIMLGTGLQKVLPWYIRVWLMVFGRWMEGIRKPKESAQHIWDIVHTLRRDESQLEFPHLGCQHFDGAHPIESSSLSHDPETQQDLWSVSARLTGLDV